MLPTSETESESTELRTYLDVLGRRWRIIAAIALVALVVALGLSLRQSKVYSASADVLMSQRSTDAVVNDSLSVYSQSFNVARRLTNEVRTLESGTTRDAVAAVYDGPLDPADVTTSVDTTTSDVVTVKLRSTDPVEAAALVNKYIEVFVDLSRKQRIEELLNAANEIQAQLNDLNERIVSTRAPLTSVEEQLNRDPGNADLESRRNDLTLSLTPTLKPLQDQRDSYQATLENLRLSAGIVQTGGPRLLTEAEVPTSPVAPQPLKTGALALVVGLLLGVVVAFVRDSLDERIRGMADLERAARGIPVLAGVPEVRADQHDSFVAVRDDPKSVTAEAFRTLRTSVKFAALDDPIRVLQVTSALSGEGKTTAVANLAEAFAQGGERVVVVCCDLRRPKIQRRFGQGLGPGFTDVLLNEVSIAAGLRQVHDRLYLLPAGSPPPNPSELLSSARATAVITALAAEFDLVIIDCTPVLPVADALVVSRLCDATLVVVDARSTKRRVLRQTIQRLVQVNAPVRGLILNGIGIGNDYQYGYGYGYGVETPEPPADPAPPSVPAVTQRG